MLYLSEFVFPDADTEQAFFAKQRRTCYDSYYPFQIFPKKGLRRLDFEPVTLLYGGNGSGKTTALNIIADTLRLQRGAPYNRTSFFGDYLCLCHPHTLHTPPKGSCILTSDDVFDHMLDMRALNEGIDTRREAMFAEVVERRSANFQMRSMEDFEELKKVSESRRLSQSQYVRRHLLENVRTHSNGESAFLFFNEKIRENALYLLDEPENSLSPQRQQELAQFLSDSARFYSCQFIIATHAPFLLAMPGAKIYDLDTTPVRPRRWTELENVRATYDFFKQHQGEF